jgi:hypothetical protein
MKIQLDLLADQREMRKESTKPVAPAVAATSAGTPPPEEEKEKEEASLDGLLSGLSKKFGKADAPSEVAPAPAPATEAKKEEGKLGGLISGISKKLQAKDDKPSAAPAEPADRGPATPPLYLEGMTLVGTLKALIINRQDAKAEKLKSKYNVPEKKYWHLKLQALCEVGDWDAVDKLGGVGPHKKGLFSRSPIGWAPFVTELVKRQRSDQAKKYIRMLPDHGEQVEWFVKIDDFQDAVDLALAEESVELLQAIRSYSSNPQTVEIIERHIARLSK